MKDSGTCKMCELDVRRKQGQAPLWDDIYRTKSWVVVHAMDTSLPGWLVLVLQRHIEALDEMTEQESAELGILIRRVSISLKNVLGCEKTYVIQFAEHRDHPHVHFHVVPRMKCQPASRRSTQVFAYLGVSPEERVSEARMDELAVRVRDELAMMA